MVASPPLSPTHMIFGAASFCLESSQVRLYVTERGGHLAPVCFHLPGVDAAPYALAPWIADSYNDLPELLNILRGDFFCLPFGGQIDGPPHGESANGRWEALSDADHRLHLQLATSAPGQSVEHIIHLKDGHYAIYSEHVIAGFAGDYSYGTHPILDLSELAPETGRISNSAFHWASVYPGYFSDPADGASQALAPRATFTELGQVPLQSGGMTDLSRYPSRPGNDDLVLLAHAPATNAQPFAWTAVVFPQYVWFSLKDPADFPATMLWLSNGGRTAHPWNGRHRGRLGVEDVCSHFSDGVAISRQNRLASLGIPTVRRFTPDQPVSLRTVQAVAGVPPNFGQVVSIVPHDRNSVLITGSSGLRVIAPLDWSFVTSSTPG